MPSFKVTGVTRSRVATHPSALLPHFALQVARAPAVPVRINWATTEAFDRWLSRRQAPCDVFHVASSYGLRAMRAPKPRTARGRCAIGVRPTFGRRTSCSAMKWRARGCRRRRRIPASSQKKRQSTTKRTRFSSPRHLRGSHSFEAGIEPRQGRGHPDRNQAGGVLPGPQARRHVPRAVRRDDVREKGHRIPARGDVATSAAEQRGGPAGDRPAGIARDSVALRRSVHPPATAAEKRNEGLVFPGVRLGACRP